MVRFPTWCIIVNKTYDKKHEFGVTYCHQCSTKHNVNDLCYIQRIKEREPDPEDPPSKYLYIFYDFETRQDDSYKNHPTITEHSPVLCVVQQACTDCLDSDDLSVLCPTCEIRELILDRDPVNQLIDFCVRPKTSFTQIIALAHNSAGFDCQFILRALTEERHEECHPSVILNGRNIISLKIGNMEPIYQERKRKWEKTWQKSTVRWWLQ